MTTAEIKEKVIGFVHTKDAKGEWILPWTHKTDCHICDQLVEFIEDMIKEHEKSHVTCFSCGAHGCCKKSESYFKSHTMLYERKCAEIIEKWLNTPPEASPGWKHFKVAGWAEGPVFCLNKGEPGPLRVVEDETHTCK